MVARPSIGWAIASMHAQNVMTKLGPVIVEVEMTTKLGITLIVLDAREVTFSIVHSS